MNDPSQEKKRTTSQNNALHLFYEQLSRLMQENGITMKAVLEKAKIEAPATKYGIKEFLWKPLMKAVLGKESTRELLKQKEIDIIWDSLNLFFANEFKISIPPFPSYDSKAIEELIKEN